MALMWTASHQRLLAALFSVFAMSVLFGRISITSSQAVDGSLHVDGSG